MSDIIGMVVALVAIGLMLGLYRMGWWHGYSAAHREYMEALERQGGKNWRRLMEGRMQREESDVGKR